LVTLTSKVEAALAAYLSGLTLPDEFTAAQIQVGQTDEDKDGQLIICAAFDSNEEIPPYTGNFMVPVGIELHTPATDDGNGGTTLGLHQTVAEFLEAAFMADDLAAQLTAAQSDFTCMGFVDRKFLKGEQDGIYMSGVSMTLYCNGINP
jgi:hypothetical protein